MAAQSSLAGEVRLLTLTRHQYRYRRMSRALTVNTDNRAILSDTPRGATAAVEERRGHAPKSRSRRRFLPVENSVRSPLSRSRQI